jgi:hypothetical protein
MFMAGSLMSPEAAEFWIAEILPNASLQADTWAEITSWLKDKVSVRAFFRHFDGW